MLTILSGPANSGKTERLLRHYRNALVRWPPGSILWLAPTWRAEAEVRLRLFDGEFCGCFQPGVMTFKKFAETMLHAAGLPIRPITRLMKRELVRQIIGEQSARGRLKHFASIAATGGLVDLVCEFIGELKRLEIWPPEFHRACLSRGIGDKDVELSEIYDVYQQALREHGLFDAEGRFWSARDVLRKAEGGRRKAEGNSAAGDPSVLHPSSLILHLFHLVVLDGFTDFTRTEHEIIEILARRAEATIVALPLEPEPRRGDLFAKPLKTLAELRRRHPDLQVEEVSRPAASDWPAMAHLERMLFVNPRETGDGGKADEVASGQWPVASQSEIQNPKSKISNPQSPTSNPSPATRPPSPVPSPTGIEILAAARQVGEIELIAGRIKRLLVDGEARPGDVAVVFRTPQELGGLVGEVFGRLGVPVMFESGDALERSPALRALAALLQLDLDDWPFNRLLAVLGSNYFQPGWPEWRQGLAAADVERTIRTLQIPSGRGRLIEQLRGKEGRGAGDEGRAEGGGWKAEGVASQSSIINHQSSISSPPIPNPSLAPCISSASIATAVLQHLADALDALPQRATLSQWAKAWQQLAKETGLLGAIDPKAEKKNNECGMMNDELNGTKPTDDRASVIHHSSFIIHHSFSDRLAWSRLMEVLAAGDTLATWLKRRPPELDRRAAGEALLDVLRSERVGHAGDESGYVRVLSAHSIRSLHVPYLFLAGLSEKVFPPPEREDRLYSEAEYGRLIDAGLPFVARTERTREEMLLFYEAITRAGKRLYLSYPALDESAQPLLPSPFLQEVEQAFEGRGERTGSETRIPRTQWTDLSPIPRDDEPLSHAEFRVKAMAMAMEGNVAMLAGLMRGEWGEGRGTGDVGRAEGGRRKAEEVASQSTIINHQSSISNPSSLSPSAFRLPPSALSSNLAAGLELIHLRQDHDRFGPAEGVLRSSEARGYLSTRFPLQHTFAATELERYASCPFRFFMERVLRIEPVEDLALEFDVLHRGRVVHDVLAVFHRRVNQRMGRAASPLELDAAEFDVLLAEAIAESLPPEPANPVQAALREIDRRLVVEWLSRYRTQLEKYGELWRGFDSPMAPELFEVSFGRGDEPPPSTAQPLDFSREGETVRISGRIDRIDTGVVAGKTVCNVLDYKTGGPIRLTPESIRAGTTLQLPLYAMAAVELLLVARDVLPWQAGYWYVRESGFRPRQTLRMYRNDDGRIELEPGWEELRAGLGDTVVMLVHAIRRGQFPVCSSDERCTGRCPYSTICRINQVRSLEKTCQPTASE